MEKICKQVKQIKLKKKIQRSGKKGAGFSNVEVNFTLQNYSWSYRRMTLEDNVINRVSDDFQSCSVVNSIRQENTRYFGFKITKKQVKT